MDIPAGIAAELALTRQAVALSVIKQAADMEKQLVAILDQAVANVPVSSIRGNSFDMKA